MGSLADSSAKTLPSFVMLLNTPCPPGSRLLFFRSTKKKLLIMSTGDSCAPRSLPWGLVHPLSLGWICSIPVSRVLSTSTVISLPFLVYPVVSDRVVPCPLFFMFLCLKSWRPTFVVTPVSLVFVFLDLPPSPISQYADNTSLILLSDDAIVASFEVYSLFEKASGSKLNQAKSKGLWLGGWSGHDDPPVELAWNSVKIKALVVFVGVGNLELDNWRPRVTAVDNAFKSWRSRSLSFRGKSFVINALAPSRIWYVASLVHMPPWVLKELSTLVYSFFWSGKRDLVSRSVVIQPSLLGGFSVVDVKFNVWSLLGQWVMKFASSPSGWVVLSLFGLSLVLTHLHS